MKSLIDIMGVATMKDNIFLMTQISVANFLYVVKKRMENSNIQRNLAIIASNLLELCSYSQVDIFYWESLDNFVFLNCYYMHLGKVCLKIFTNIFGNTDLDTVDSKVIKM